MKTPMINRAFSINGRQNSNTEFEEKERKQKMTSTCKNQTSNTVIETYKSERRYGAYLIADKLEHRGALYKNVRIELFKTDTENNKEVIDFKAAIKNYDPRDEDNKMTEAAIKEKFTHEEIQAMRSYFKADADVTFHSHEVRFPVVGNLMPTGLIGTGGRHVECEIFRWKDYPLDFKICGHINFRDCELDDEFQIGILEKIKKQLERRISALRNKLLKVCGCRGAQE